MNSLAAIAAMSTLAASFTASPSGSLPELSLDVDRCPSLPRQEVARLAALELDARVSPPQSVNPQPTRVVVACTGANVQMTVSDRLTGKQLIRTIEIETREANVAARLVALAVSELVITSWMELTFARPTPPSDSGATPSPALVRAAQERAEHHAPSSPGAASILLLAQATGPFARVGFGLGGGLRLGWTFGSRWIETATIVGQPAADLELTGSRSDVGDLLGDVHVSMWSAALRGSFRLRRGRAWLDLGAGGRFGLARLEGAPVEPTTTVGHTLAGTWTGLSGYGGVGVQLGRVIVAAGAEIGYVLRSVNGLIDNRAPVSVSGRWLSGTLAIGWGQ